MFFSNDIMLYLGVIMDNLNTKKTIQILNDIMKYELSGVVRYTHYSLMITGRDRLSLTQFFKNVLASSKKNFVSFC